MKRLPVFLLCLSLGTPTLFAATDLSEKLDRSAQVLSSLLEGDEPPPPQLLEATSCVVVVPRLIKGAFGIGGRRGKGVIACRQENGAWSPPAFVKISGGSIGFQIGGQSTDLVLLVVDDRSARSLLKSRFTIGADASVAAGPRSLEAQAATDARLDAEIYSYARSKGLFAGAAVDGAKVSLYRKAIPRYYDAYVRPEDILFGRTDLDLPPSARRFRDSLP